MRDHRLNQLFLRYRQSGDPRALSKLFDGLSSELLKVARHVAHDDAEAEDLVQATFLTAMEHPERFDESRPITAWLVGVLTKEALSWRRQSARRPDADRVLDPQVEREVRERPEVHASGVESEGLFAAALERLPLRYRDVLERHLQRGQSPSEIAREQNASPATVRVRLHRGMAQLRQLLPAGMAGGLVLSLSPRGLAAVRAELVSHASTLTAVTATTAASGAALTTAKLGSLLMAQRIGIGALGVLMLAFLTNLALDAGSTPNQTAFENEVVRLLDDTENQATAGIQSADERKDATTLAGNFAADQAASPIDLASKLRVNTRWADGTPAPHIAFQYTSFAPNSTIQSAVTDASGSITLPDMAPGQYALYGDRGGFGNATVLRMTIDPNTPGGIPDELKELLTQETTLTLESGTDVRGRVLDENGRGVANASIWISTGLTRDSGFEIARSAADGSYEVKQLTSQCFFGARSAEHAPSKPQYVQYWNERLEDSDALELDLQLGEPAARIHGRVLDPSGQPVAGARVRVGAQDFFDSYGPTGASGPPPPLEVVTNELGEFECSGLQAGQVEVACLANGFPVALAEVRIDSGARGQVELRLQPGAWVTGQVTLATGEPIADVTVSAHQRALNLPHGSSSFDEPRCKTDRDGRFRLGPLVAGECNLRAQTQNRQETDDAQVELSYGGTYEWNPKLSGLPTISGVALSTTGTPLENWYVSSKAATQFGPLHVTGGRTSADGSFEITVSGDGEFRLELFAPEPTEHPDRTYRTMSAPSTWIEGIRTGERNVRIILNPEQQPTARLAGELIPPLGRSTPKTFIRVYHETFVIVAEREFPAGTSRFEFPNLPAGEVHLLIEAIGHAQIWSERVQLEHGGVHDLGEFDLVTAGALRVGLNRHDGGLPEHIQTELKSSEGLLFYLPPNGSVLERDDLPPGEYTLRVQAQDCGPAQSEFTVREGERTAFDLTLPSGGSIGFVLLGAGDSPLGAHADLRVTDSNGAIVFEETLEPGESGAVGRWFFAPHGSLTVVAEAKDGRRAQATLSFSASDDASTPRVLRLE